MATRFHQLTAQALLQDAVKLALAVHDSGYRPDLLIALWRGGTPIGMAMHEVFALWQWSTAHCVLSTRSYTNPTQQHDVQLTGLESLSALLTANQNVLVVDDVFDSGRTYAAVHAALLAIEPTLTIKLATPWYKPDANTTHFTPDYHLHTTEAWLIFPHELVGLPAEQLANKPDLAPLIADVLRRKPQ